MGSVTFTDSYQISSYGYYEQNVEVNFTESYSSATNKTTVTLSSIRMKSEYAGGSSPVYGDVSFSANGSSWTSVKSMSGGTNQVYLATSYSTIDGSSGGSLDITHAADGTATLYVRLSGGSGGYWGALVQTYGKPSRMFGIETPDTESASLTTHTQKLTVNPNGGSWGGSTSSQSFNQAPTSTKTIANPTRTGYTFTGWTKSGGGSISGTTYTFGSSDGTLTANWQINTWTVSYNANGGTGAPASQTKTYGQTLTLSTTKPTKANTTPSPASYTVTYKINYTGGTDPAAATAARTTSYSFSQWKATDGTLYNSGGSYTKNEGTTMTAQWSSSTTTAAVTLPTPTRTGYTFKGWSTSSTATTGTTGSYTPTGNVTLYAVWQINSYTLTLTKGDYISSVTGGGSKNYGASVTATAVLGSSTGYTYSFTGWYEGATRKSTSLSYSFTMPAGALTLTAKGARTANTYTVKFNANRGTGASGGGTMANEGFTYDVSKALTPNAFTRYFTVTYNANGGSVGTASDNANSSFSGWATSASGAVVYADGAGVKNLTSTNGGSVNLYAKWSNGSVTLPTPTRVGYTFTGWYTAASGGTKVGDAGAIYTPTASSTLYAQWTAISYDLSVTMSDTGVAVNVLRTASPYVGAPNGLLNSGDPIYYGDVLAISYVIGGGYQKKTATLNGEDFGGDYSGSVSIASVQSAVVLIVLVKIGALAYVGNEAYQVFVGAVDGSAYGQYEAFIGNADGTAWEAY